MNKAEEIIKVITSIDLDKWQLVKEQGTYDRYETTFKDVLIQLWTCMTDGGRPFLQIDSSRLWDKNLFNGELIAPFLKKLRANDIRKEDGLIDELYKKLVSNG